MALVRKMSENRILQGKMLMVTQLHGSDF